MSSNTKNKQIFLSYRRDDVPGYVGRLEDELEKAFGEDRIFRDVDDIAGGSEWKQIIDQNLIESGALILVIGPRWKDIWEARRNDPANYVALELERARELGVDIIPVTLGNAELPSRETLGSLGWLMDKQVYDISDRQSRWDTDVQGLVRIIERIDAIGLARTHGSLLPATELPVKKRSGLIWAFAALAVLGFGIWTAFTGHDGSEFDDEFKPAETQPERPAPEQTSRSPVSEREALKQQAEPPRRRPPTILASRQASESTLKFIPGNHPDISGSWKSKKLGTIYTITNQTNGRFDISIRGASRGKGNFIPRMPGKFEFNLDNGIQGQFVFSQSNQWLIGWTTKNKSSQQFTDTLIKIN